MGVRKYVVVTVLVWLLIGAWGLYLALEGHRLATAEERQLEDLIHRGVQLYAENCVICHGANGQGVVGPPLNRAAWKGDPREDRETFELLRNTIARGRPGTSNPRWELLPTGEWASYTAMPTFGAEHGGPFNEQQLRALASFIMAGDWSEVGAYIPAPNIPSDPEELYAGMPDAQGVSEEINRRGKEIFVSRGCITCHTVGSVGGHVGPNLSAVGSWSLLNREYWGDFLWDWIANPSAVKNRAPVYWSNYTGPLPYAEPVQPVREAQGQGGEPGAVPQRGRGRSQQFVSQADAGQHGEIPSPVYHELPTQMPTLAMPDEERDILVEYLLGLRG